MQNFSRRNFLKLQWLDSRPPRPSDDSQTSSTTTRAFQDLISDDVDSVTRCCVALRTDLCLAWGGTNCVQCYIACPLQGSALDLNDGRPILNPAGCNGCALCVIACSTVNNLEAMRLTRSPARPESCAAPPSRA